MTFDRSRSGRRLVTRLLIVLLLAIVPGARAGEEEAKPEPVDLGALRLVVEHRVGGLTLRQYELRSLSHLSYLLAVGDEAVVVDPVRDVDTYVNDAAAQGCVVKRVVLTRLPFDIVAGHDALRERTGAAVLLHADSPAGFDYQGVEDGHEEKLGEVTLEFWLTPGAARGALTILVHAPGTSIDPAYALTGGALAIGGIGRLDLGAGDEPVQARAEQAFDTIQRLKLLPDETRLLPGIADGSLSGVKLTKGTMSTIGAQRKDNAFVRAESRGAFVGRALDGLPMTPAYFAAAHALNRAGEGGSTPSPEFPPETAPEDVWRAVRERDAILVDVRPADTYAAMHVFRSLNLPLFGRFETWFGAVVPFSRDVYVLGSDDEVREAQRRLHRIAFPGFAGRVAGGLDACRGCNVPTRPSRLVQPKTLERQIAAWIEPVLVDVRSEREFMKRRLPNVVHAPITRRERWPELFARDRPLVFICKTAYRSTLAIGFAEQMGFQRVGSLDGGVLRWVELGLPTVVQPGSTQAAPKPPPAEER